MSTLEGKLEYKIFFFNRMGINDYLLSLREIF